MKSFKIILLAALALFFAILFTIGIDVSDKTPPEQISTQVPRIGQKLWTYNIKNRQWRNYNKKDYSLDKNNEIILQIQQDTQNPEVTSYNLISDNPDISVSDLFLGEGSKEFLYEEKLYSYFPRTFEYFEVVFNGFNFALRKLDQANIINIFKNYQVIELSEFKDQKLNLKYDKENSNYIILNDLGESFYMYYITSDDNSKIKIDEYSNQFKVLEPIKVTLQRIDGCTKSYPCYEINFMNE